MLSDKFFEKHKFPWKIKAFKNIKKKKKNDCPTK